MAASAPIEIASSASVPDLTIAPVDERPAIQDVLARYRRAYEGLDARSAQAVWPAVNEQALAGAFDELESQEVTFTQCDVQVRGVTADATCTGRVSYVTKVGRREPRVEPRTWTFSLRKVDSDWTIESARAER